MNKARITRFIGKYNLAGLVESVTWKTDGQKLNTRFIADDKTVLGEITLDNFNYESSELGIYTTSNLNKMLSVLGDDIDLEVQKVEDKSISLGLESDGTKANYQLADLSVIPNVPELKSLPEFDIEVELEKIKMYPKSLLKPWEVVEDHSLKYNGLEYTLLTYNNNAHKYLKQLFEIQSDVYISNRCSIHVHLNALDMTLNNIKTFLVYYLIFEKALYNYSGKRWTNIFCVPLHEWLNAYKFGQTLKSIGNIESNWEK